MPSLIEKKLGFLKKLIEKDAILEEQARARYEAIVSETIRDNYCSNNAIELLQEIKNLIYPERKHRITSIPWKK